MIRSILKSKSLSAIEMSIDKNVVEMTPSSNLYAEKKKPQSQKMNVLAYDSDDDWEMDQS